MNTQLTKIKLAARHYLRSLGMSGTNNEVTNLMNRNTGQTIFELARKAGYVAMLLLTMASCGKEELVIPAEQQVTYTLKCKDCLIYLHSDKWNPSNELDRSKQQHFNVTGDFSYTFTNIGGLDTAWAQVSVSVLYPVEQQIELTISDNQGRSTRVTETLGYSPDWRKNNPYELEAKLALR